MGVSPFFFALLRRATQAVFYVCTVRFHSREYTRGRVKFLTFNQRERPFLTALFDAGERGCERERPCGPEDRRKKKKKITELPGVSVFCTVGIFRHWFFCRCRRSELFGLYKCLCIIVANCFWSIGFWGSVLGWSRCLLYWEREICYEFYLPSVILTRRLARKSDWWVKWAFGCVSNDVYDSSAL